jgi:hypothetical protein
MAVMLRNSDTGVAPAGTAEDRRPQRRGYGKKWLTGFQVSKQMTAEQIIKEIEALPKVERERLVQRMRELRSAEIPQDFVDALEDFEKQRFVSIETALNETPPGV